MFGRGFTVFRVRGIPVRIDLTLLLVLPYVAFVATYQYAAIARWLNVPEGETLVPPLAWGAILAVGLFVSVLLHELAHAYVALRAGAEVQSITLMMLGGITRMKRDVPAEREAWMAFAGPLTSCAVAAVSFGFARIVPLAPGARVALVTFAATNLFLGAFNLIPAYPMDGGRVLRGLLVKRLGREGATRLVTGLGRIFAGIFAFVGLFTLNLILVFIAWFIYIGASSERVRSEGHDVLRGVPVGQFMSERVGQAFPDEHPAEVARRLLRDNLVGARVADPDAPRRTLGVVTARDLARSREPEGTIAEAMRTDLPKLHPRDDATPTMDALSSGEASAIVVVDDADDIVGLVLPDDLQRALTLGGVGRS
jgi:Zn-dependent protease/CBS domain-containing protein